jgi:hypothetical protein
MDLIVELQAVIRKLDECGIPYALCGGLAVAFHGYVRATQDIDLLVRPEDLEPVMNAVNGIGYNLEGGVIPLGFGEAHPLDIHRISKAVGKELATLDIVLVNPTLEPAWDSRLQVSWNGQSLWVVSKEGLGVMKRLSRRPSDLADLQNLGIPTDES